jgi:hypothetical protein
MAKKGFDFNLYFISLILQTVLPATKMSFRKLLISVFVLITQNALSQVVYKEFISPDIKSVCFNVKGDSFSYPVLQMSSETPLVLSFDEVSAETPDYYYSITLCNANWTESRLSPSEYMQGLFSYPVANYKPSFNTLVHYTHYELELPNEDLQFVLPGNYIVKVFENSDSDQPVLVKRFVMFDSKVEITAELKTPTLPEFRANSHQVDFSILNPQFQITNPQQELSVVILKNFDWNTALTDLKPLYISNGKLDYSYTRENLFIAGNEYRSFNINSRKYQSPQVTRFDFNGNNYLAWLAPDKARRSYFYKRDINGLFYVENKDVHNPDNNLESDYFEVEFALQANILPYDGDIYIYGALTGFALTDATRMKYNNDQGVYENKLLLKQGYYDYQYVFVPKTTGKLDESEIEGSFMETENNYYILVYYRGFGDRYDRPVGYTKVSR